MPLKLKPSLLLLTLLSVYSLSAQKSARFNGKPYLIYPQTIDVGYSGMSFTINERTLEIYNYNMPPVIGMVEDGEYLMYSTSFDLKNKRKIGGDVVFDTIYHVFATLTIKDNKKEGWANFYTSHDQVKPFASLPYHNDMLNGSVRIISSARSYYPRRGHYDYSYGYRSSSHYDDDYDYYSSNDVTYKSHIFNLNFKDGVLDGLQTVRKTYGKKDTVLVRSVTMVMGQLSGSTISNTYYLEKKKLRLYKTTSGNYVKGEKQGEWMTKFGGTKYYNNSYFLDHFINGKMTSRLYYFKGKLEHKYIFGKDSVMKYATSFKTDKRMPIVKDYTFSEVEGSASKDFIYFSYRDTTDDNYTYVIGDSAKTNYFKIMSYWKNMKDTSINGKFVLISRWQHWRGGIVENAYLVDSCSKEDQPAAYSYHREYGSVSSNAYCKIELWEKTYNKKGISTTFTMAYEKMFTGDSLIPKSKSKYKKKSYTAEDFYQMALDYNYTNVKFVKGRYNNYQRYHVVSGGARDGRVLHVIKIPTHYDTLTITDTLMLKGKFLYKYDDVFYKAFGDYYDDLFDNRESSSPKAYFNQKLLSFFEVEPNAHRSIYLGRKPFTGSFRIHVKYVNNPNKIKARVYEITQFFDFLTKKQVIELTVELNKDIKRKYYNSFIMPVKNITIGIEEGIISGNLSFWDIYGNESISAYYTSNKMVSELEFDLYRINHHKRNDYDYDYDYDYDEPMYFRSYRPRKAEKITLENSYKVTSSSIQYADGKKFGQWHVVEDGKVSFQYNYRNDKKEGMQYVYSGYNYNALNYVYNAVRDTVDGRVWNLDMNGSPNYAGNFKMGVPHGYFTRYNEIDTLNRLSERYQFMNGYMVGRYETYRDSGELKMTIDMDINDSMYYDIYHVIPRLSYSYIRGKREASISTSANRVIESPDLSGDDFLTGIFSTSYIKRGYYRNYYKSGGVFSEGYKKSNTPIGHWNFYREGKDRIYKRIDFRDSVIEINGEDTVRSYGIVKAYYDDGRLMFTGLALDQETKYSCESEADIPTEEDYYLEFYDTIGKPVLVNGSGFIEELQANGYKLKEGRMVNGKKEGIWVYYSKFGLPSAIGAFENGKKSGRWLVGDLGGLNLNDKVCFMSNEEFIAWINTYGGNLNLTEEYYTEGKLTSGNSVDTIKR